MQSNVYAMQSRSNSLLGIFFVFSSKFFLFYTFFFTFKHGLKKKHQIFFNEEKYLKKNCYIDYKIICLFMLLWLLFVNCDVNTGHNSISWISWALLLLCCCWCCLLHLTNKLLSIFLTILRSFTFLTSTLKVLLASLLFLRELL